jgi:hypothetical protein
VRGNLVAGSIVIASAVAAGSALPGEGHAIETLPASRGGQDLLGTRFPKLVFDRNLEADDTERSDAEPSVTLYRWWTDRCPFCEASLPAIEGLRKRYQARGLRVMAVYHPKPPRRVTDDFVLSAARQRGYRGEIAVDEDWAALRKLYLDGKKRKATSVTFIVDREGIIRFVHPGPVFHPSDDPRFKRENDDYRLVEKAIRQLIEEAAVTE